MVQVVPAVSSLVRAARIVSLAAAAYRLVRSSWPHSMRRRACSRAWRLPFAIRRRVSARPSISRTGSMARMTARATTRSDNKRSIAPVVVTTPPTQSTRGRCHCSTAWVLGGVSRVPSARLGTRVRSTGTEVRSNRPAATGVSAGYRAAHHGRGCRTAAAPPGRHESEWNANTFERRRIMSGGMR